MHQTFRIFLFKESEEGPIRTNSIQNLCECAIELINHLIQNKLVTVPNGHCLQYLFNNTIL